MTQCLHWLGYVRKDGSIIIITEYAVDRITWGEDREFSGVFLRLRIITTHGSRFTWNTWF